VKPRGYSLRYPVEGSTGLSVEVLGGGGEGNLVVQAGGGEEYLEMVCSAGERYEVWESVGVVCSAGERNEAAMASELGLVAVNAWEAGR
jgi:hypothetical protein